jgi:hypothetical protein
MRGDAAVVTSFHPRSIVALLTFIARRQWISVTVIGVFAFAGSAAVGFLAGIPEPLANDEFSYWLAADTFARGRLTNPTHPIWVHFEGSHAIHQPTYMSKYPPAQGMVLAAGQLIAGHPIWGVWLSMGLMCAAICWMLYAWMPPRWATLGGLFALLNPLLGISGYWAQSYWGGAVAATGGSLVMGALPRVVRRPCWRDALFMGAGLAILANSRPYEGLVLAAPASLMLLFSLLRKRGTALWVFVGQVVTPLLVVLALTGAAIGYYNFRITGDMFRMPYQVHEETYAIAPIFVWQSLRPEPIYHHEALRDARLDVDLNLYRTGRSTLGFVIKNVAYLTWWAAYSLNIFLVPLIATFSLTWRWALRNRWPRFALQTYGFFIFGQLLIVWMMIHYFAPITGFNYLFALQATRLWKWRKRSRTVRRILVGLIPAAGLLALVVSLHAQRYFDDPSAWYKRRASLLEQLTKTDGEHLIIVRYGPGHRVHEEWVRNGAEIDAAKVVWARAMDDDHNCRLAVYFKQRHIWSLNVESSQSKSELQRFPLERCQ